MVNILYNNILSKILLILSFMLIILVLAIITQTPPAGCYEISIYDAFPWYFWFLISTAICIGMSVIILQIFTKRISNLWLLGLLIVIISNSIVLSIPFFRGYGFFPSGDALEHIGYMRDIINTGYIGETNFYPVVHLLGTGLLKINNLEINVVTNLLSVSWSIMYLLNMCLLSTVITTNRKKTLFMLVFSCPLIFSSMHLLIHPSMLSIFLLPLLLYFYHKKENISSNRISFTLLLIIIAITLTFAHPLTCLFTIILLFGLVGSRKIFIKMKLKNFSHIAVKKGSNSLGVPLIMTIVFFIWYFPYLNFQNSLKYISTYLLYADKTTLYGAQINILSNTSLTFLQTIEVFFYRYGGIFIYLLLSTIAILVVLKSIFSKKEVNNPINIDYSVLFVIAFISSAFSLFGFTGEVNPVRISRLFLIISPILLGLVYYKYIEKNVKPNAHQRKKIFVFILFVLICSVAVLNIFNIYGSSRTVQNNWQVTEMDISGSEWFVNVLNRDINASSIGIKIRSFEHFTFGSKYSHSKRVKIDVRPVPSHFGYDKNSSIAETFNYANHYLLINEAGISFIELVPENVRDNAYQYTYKDFIKLHNDETANLIYLNGEFEIWKTS